MKRLVLAEKPSVAKDIAGVLKCEKNIPGGIEGEQYVITWAYGHLVELKNPEDYDKKYMTWKMEDLPIIPEYMQLNVIRKTAGQFQNIKKLLARADINEIIIATDAGREGELVARWILKLAGNQKKCKRLWISSVTDKAIKEGFANLKDASLYDALYFAAVQRAEADWLIGMNASRALTCKYQAQLSCGRVQTPTLSMIYEREREIAEFIPKAYYEMHVTAEHLNFILAKNTNESKRVYRKEEIENIAAALKEEQLVITKISKKEEKESPELLYNLTELQKDADHLYGYSAKHTLNILQGLYERHKIVTYPRTDSRYVSSDIVDTLKERLESCGVGNYKKYAQIAIKRIKETTLFFVKDTKVTDHHAIIPTEAVVHWKELSIEERRIYELIVKRFISVFFQDAVYEKITIEGTCKDELLLYKNKRLIKAGWKEIDDQTIKTEDRLDLTYKEGESYFIKSVQIKEGKTKAPKRFTEAELLGAMEHPQKYMSEKNMIHILNETGGLGTVATRADIIEKIIKSGYVEKKGKELYITSKGKQLLSLVPQELKQPELTAAWEYKLSEIANGKNADYFAKEIRSYTIDILEQIKQNDKTYRHDNITGKKCPECGKFLLEIKGKNSTRLQCQDINCGYKTTISRVTNARCPICHKKMDMVGTKEKSMFVCGCGYKEKLNNFQERKKKEGAGVKKRDVAQYMKKQKKEAEMPMNTAFADAFKLLNSEEK